NEEDLILFVLLFTVQRRSRSGKCLHTCSEKQYKMPKKNDVFCLKRVSYWPFTACFIIFEIGFP
ncbi:hypothetical protein, partial [Photobacterium alginatilyticum]|uniref:hypothetical protein n=1 Tax=Photobacterium alginatilyticum TaxID=1775171 RepID=UPI0019630067